MSSTKPTVGELIEASSLGTPEAKALREEGRRALCGEDFLTGMPEEQADWDGEHCEPLLDDDGQIIAVARVSDDITDEGRAALRSLVDAARRQFEADLAADPSIGERQAASIARIRERNRRLRGEPG